MKVGHAASDPPVRIGGRECAQRTRENRKITGQKQERLPVFYLFRV
jgi:hypothetical protein